LDFPKEKIEELQRLDRTAWRREVIRHEEPYFRSNPGSIVANEYYVFGFFLGITADFDICLRAASREIQRI
jgi:hypothetical protein